MKQTEEMMTPVWSRVRHSARDVATRLFFTCWLIYTLHFATNTVREIYLALSIGDHLSFRVDDYAGMHPDLFEKPGYGWHIGANPGASMLAAIPYMAAKPVIDAVSYRVIVARTNASAAAIPAYNSPWPMAQKFFEESWRRGYDIKFGLGAFVMQAFCMAPISAVGVVGIFFVLRRLLQSERSALWLALLYAFGTPVFLRTGYLSHNMILGHVALFGFLALWNPDSKDRPSLGARAFLGGLAGGTAVLFDYSGVVPLMVLFAYLLLKTWRGCSIQILIHRAFAFFFGSLGPIALLWYYQWASFGHLFYPGQHWMPPVQWIDKGYQGFTGPQWDLFFALIFDYRFGLFLSAPVLILGFLYPLYSWKRKGSLGRLELWTFLGVSVGLILFFSGVQYTRLQFNTGIRYLAPVLPFLFIPAALLLARLPGWAQFSIATLSVVENWCLAMHRDVERGMGLLDPILAVFLGGFQLPALTTLSRIQTYREFFPNGPSALPPFALAAVIIWAIWNLRLLRAKS